ncbi:MAG: nuclear transport factor 2 family protein [Deltaproteobacteria bacterium]|nr:nuclear transport factor 2 family protein [Deltaproteobacteria bacterium]
MADAKQIVQAYFDRATVGDPTFGQLFEEDATWWVPESSPLGGTHVGRRAILDMLERAFALYDPESMKVEVLELFGEGEHVCARFQVDSLTARGRHWKGDYLALFRIVDDRIRSVREYFDTKRLIPVVFE